jgi:hypothetical protein
LKASHSLAPFEHVQIAVKVQKRAESIILPVSLASAFTRQLQTKNMRRENSLLLPVSRDLPYITLMQTLVQDLAMQEAEVCQQGV